MRNFLFRYRGQLPLITISIIFLLGLTFPIPLVRQTSADSYRCLSLILVGFGIVYRCWTVGYSMQHASGRNRHQQVAHHLNQRGTYSMSQHPLYFANALMWLGCCIFSNSLLILVALGVYISIFTFYLIQLESRFLHRTFGEEFAVWAQNTPVFVPFLWKYKRTGLPFQWVKVFATEYPTWVSCLASLLAADLFNSSVNLNNLQWTNRHSMIVIAGCFIGFSGRFFKYVVVRKWLKSSI